MKVIALNSSKRKQNTYGVLTRIGNLLAQQGIAYEIINLFDYHIEECIGCMHCIRKDTCVFEKRDDMAQLMHKLEACDGIILATPVYLRQVSGRMKTFIDRTCKWYHRSPIGGKPCFFVATTAGSGLKSTLDYLQDVAYQWGMLPTGRIGLSIRDMERTIEAKELAPFVQLMTQGPTTYKLKMKQVMDYQLQKVLALKTIPEDRVHWEAQGLFDKDFYVPCHIAWYKKYTGRAFYRFMSKVINPKKVEGTKEEV